MCLSGCDFQVNLEGKRIYDCFFCFFLPAVTRVQCERMKQKKVFSIKAELLCLAPVNGIIWLPNNPFQKKH